MLPVDTLWGPRIPNRLANPAVFFMVFFLKNLNKTFREIRTSKLNLRYINKLFLGKVQYLFFLQSL